MITCWRGCATVGLLMLVLGCGGGDKSQPAAQGDATQAAGPPDPAAQMAGAPGQMGPGMMPGMPGAPGSPPSGPPQAAAGAETAATPAKPAYDGPDPIQLLPPSLKQALGVRLGALGDPAHPLNKVLYGQFKPISTLLARTGIKPQEIESVWVGSNRETNDVLLCVRTTEKFSPEAVRKTLQAEKEHDKIGKSEIYLLPDHPIHQNAVAFLDMQTLLIGRLTTVSDALKNPKAGSIRLGLEAAKASQAVFWLSQDPAMLQQEIAKSSNEAVAALMAQAAMPKGFAVAIAPASSGSPGANPGGFGGPGAFAGGPPPGAPSASGPPAAAGAGVRTASTDAVPGAPPPAGAVPPAGSAPPAGAAGGHAAPGRSGPPGPPSGPPAGHGGPPAGAGAPPPGAFSGPPGAGNFAGPPGAVDANSLELAIGVSFDSEGTADAVEKQIKTALQLVQQSGGQFGGSAAGFQPPPQGGPPGGGIRLGVDGGGTGADGAGARPPGAFPPSGPNGQRPPAGSGPGMRPPNMGNVGGGQATNNSPAAGIQLPGGGGSKEALSQMVLSVISSVTVTHEKEKLRIAVPLPSTENADPIPLMGFVLQTTGASALGDGLFEGSLDLLSRGMKQWGTTNPDTMRGVTPVGQLPLRSGYSWMTHLLPFIGRDDLYSQFDFKKSWDDPQNQLLASQAIPAFLNPADSRTNWTGSQYTGLGVSHFVGVSGVEDAPHVIAATLNRSDPRAGVFGYDRLARPDEITDGQAQTIMIIGAGGLASPWVMGGGATVRGARAPYIDDLRGFGSRGLPKGGAYAIFADGSARVIAADIDPAIFKAMCTIHGNDKAE